MQHNKKLIKKTTLLKELILSDSTEFLMEAHNGLSAIIAEKAGFKGLWASGLSMSAALGVRDANEASWTQILQVCEFMSDATSIPILVDADTGYGNFNNARRLIKKLEQIEIAGCCIEDKLFPKKNSFIDGKKQQLEDIDTFCGKIKAIKDSQRDDNFITIARTEAFIAGHGLKAALSRAEAYRQAGADAILVHSKIATAKEITEFMQEWANRHPVVIVPTKYFSTPTELFRKLKINLVIWANHNCRAAITAMEKACQTIYQDQSLHNIENQICSVKEVFNLQNINELQDAEQTYLPKKSTDKAIILAASKGDDLGELTDNIPKTLLKVNGKSILQQQIDNFNKLNINNKFIVTGFKQEKINKPDLEHIFNKNHNATREIYSLKLALDKITGPTIISYGDIIYKYYTLYDLTNSDSDITIICDSNKPMDGEYHDYISTNVPPSKANYMTPYQLTNADSQLPSADIHGEFIGLMRFSSKGTEIAKQALNNLAKRPDFNKMRATHFLKYLCNNMSIAIRVIYIQGDWLDINTIESLHSTTQPTVALDQAEAIVS